MTKKEKQSKTAKIVMQAYYALLIIFLLSSALWGAKAGSCYPSSATVFTFLAVVFKVGFLIIKGVCCSSRSKNINKVPFNFFGCLYFIDLFSSDQ
jgi:hypothetical protein